MLLVACLCLTFAGYPQSENKTFRKCYIIAYKSNAKFSSTEQNTNLKSSLMTLFNNRQPEYTSDQHTRIEANCADLFNAKTDEILFFDFGMKEKKLSLSDAMDIFNYFIDNYFYLQNQYSLNGGDVDVFFDDCFSKCHNNIRGILVSPSSCVFPLILAKIPQGINAEEYYLVMLSNYNDPTGKGQDEDITRLDEVISKSSRLILENNFINPMRSKINQSEIFQYGYKYYPYGQSNAFNPVRNYAYLVGYKIVPENIVPPTIESNIKFEQLKYGEDLYKRDAVRIRFSHSDNLRINSIYEDISAEKGKNRKIETFKEDNFYIIDSVEVELADSIHNTDFNSLNVKYTFNGQLQLLDAPNRKLGLVYITAPRSLSQSDIVFQPNLSEQKDILTALIILFAIILLLFILYRLGKPTGISFKWSRFTDRYESTDFSENGKGRILTDYMNWKEQYEKNGKFQIKVQGEFTYRRNRFYNWKRKTGFPITITPLILETPQGFSAQVECGTRVSNSPEYSIHYENAFHNGKFEFFITCRKDKNIELTEPLYFKFQIEARAKKTGFQAFFCSGKLQDAPYEFHVGPNLGNVWVGLDPGTTGSCIATATRADDLVIGKNSDEEDRITLSEITIDPDKITNQSEEKIRSACYFGDNARSRRKLKDNMIHFVSTKKLVGYADKFTLKEGVEIDGVLLSSLLIEYLFKDHKECINGEKLNYPQFFVNEKYIPQRLAIAIPNNFTATKIQHLKESIEKIPNIPFKEIRFIYEAEAMLVHYINQSDADTEKQMSKEGETIFVYDMGGATINATIANIKRRQNKTEGLQYHVTVISKLGYGIGGDTIDYAFIEWIYSKQGSYTQLRRTNPFGENVNMEWRHDLKEAVLQLKMSAINNNNNNKSKYLLDRDLLVTFGKGVQEFGRSFNGNPFVLELDKFLDDNNDFTDADPFNNQCLKGKNSFLYDPIFEEYIWSNIETIVNDTLELCQEKDLSLDTIIMAGRSSHFPRVKETVEKTISQSSSFDPKIIQWDATKSKSMVAKGACYYGAQNKIITMKNRTTNGAFGVIQKLDNIKPAHFHELINVGRDFNEEGRIDETMQITEQKDFAIDGGQVRFCQVMGVNPEQIIAKDEKHKYSNIATLSADPHPIERVSMEITDKDKIFCTTWDTNGECNTEEARVKDAEIAKSNEEHYTFFIK